jgi:hypothetical protein
MLTKNYTVLKLKLDPALLALAYTIRYCAKERHPAANGPTL